MRESNPPLMCQLLTERGRKTDCAVSTAPAGFNPLHFSTLTIELLPEACQKRKTTK